MNKKFRRYFMLSILVLVAVFVTLFLQKPTEKEDDDKFDEVPLTDLASTYEGKATDENGNLLAPFDVVYPEVFNSGEYKYDENYVLLKFDNSFNGKLTERLEKCGIVNLSSFMTGVDGTWYKCKIGYDTDVKTVVMKTRSLSEVLVADFDYIYEQTADEVQVGPADGGPGPLHEKVQKNEKSADQWYLKASGIQEAWKYLEKEGIEPGGSSDVVVAVIDTGVDYNHDDLKANMWVNTAEIAGNGIDDDDNGYIDDIHGVNVIANNGTLDKVNIGNPMDDNGHGTHVAGIISASNNKIGVVGIAYNAKIMAVKAGQATGVFLQSDIAEAILYAYQMGADVINMSFGGPSCSIAVQDALTQSYTTATLVASAGNDGKPNEPADNFEMYPEYMPNYPAALSYVIGVMSVDERDIESSFSNWDTEEFNTVEYEVYAPGESIMSTLPNNNYGKLSGTSMAAPVVSGIAALLRSYYTDRDMYPSKFISAQLCATSEDVAKCINPELHKVNEYPHNLPMVVNAHKALTKLPKPDIGVVDYYIFDDPSISAKNNGDGIADAGETLYISPVLRNRWGMSKDTIVTLDVFTNKELNLVNPYVEIINKTINYEGVGTYSTKDYLVREGSVVVGCENPFIVKIADNCPNDYLISFNATITYGNALDDKDKTEYVTVQSSPISFWARNGVILPSQINEDIILTKENYYIIPNSTYIPEGVTVIVEEGTQIQFWSDDPSDPYANTYIASLVVDGSFITHGTEEEPVKIFPSESLSNYIVEIKKGLWGYVELEYTEITNPYLNITYMSHCTIKQNFDRLCTRDSKGGDYGKTPMMTGQVIQDSIIYKVSFGYNGLSSNFHRCAFIDTSFSVSTSSCTFSDCVFMGNSYINQDESYNNSYLELCPTDEINIRSVKICDDTKKPYILVLCPISGTAIVEEFAESIGGHLVCIETQEELEFVKSFKRTFAIGLNNDFTQWVNGASFDLDINTSPSSTSFNYSPYASYNHQTNCIENITRHDDHYYFYFLIEIEDVEYCENIYLDNYDVEIDLEEEYQIHVNVNPTSYDRTKLIYVSEDPSVAVVDENGLVKPLREGTVVINVYSKDFNITNKCTITIKKKVKIEDFEIICSNTQWSIGDIIDIRFNYFPSNTTEHLASVESSDPNVLFVDDVGNITAVGVGEATITVKIKDISKTIKLSVVTQVSSIAFEEKFYITYMGDTDESWKPIILPIDATNKNIDWLSSNPEIAYVDESGNLIRVSPGNTTIRANVEKTNLYAEITVSVNPDIIGDNLKVLEMDCKEYSGVVTAVLSDYTAWVWGTDFLAPVKISDDIKSIYAYYRLANNCIKFYAANLNGDLLDIKYDLVTNKFTINISSLKINNISKLYSSDSSLNSTSNFALLNDGSVFAWGNNYYGQLGIGSTTTPQEPVQMLINDVRQIYCDGSNTFIVSNSDKMYVAGSKNYYTEPLLLHNDIKDLRCDGYYLYITFKNKEKKIYSLYSNNFYEYNSADNYYNSDNLVNYLHWKITNNKEVITSNSNYILENLGFVDNLFVFANGNLAFIVTENGELYGIGENSNGELANLNKIDSNILNKIFFGLNISDAKPEIENDILSHDILYQSDITFDFSYNLVKGNEFSNIKIKDSKGYYVGLEKYIILDKLYIAPLSELKDGETYTLTIPANSFTSLKSSNDSIEYTFIYHNKTEISLENSTLCQGDILYDYYFDETFTFSYALSGENFGDIALIKDDHNVDFNVSLENSILSIDSVLEPGLYTLYIPIGALKDNIGGVNEELIFNFSVYEACVIIENSLDDLKRVDELDNICIEFKDIIEGDLFSDITLTNDDLMIDTVISIVDNTLIVKHNGLIQGESYKLYIPSGAIKTSTGFNNEVLEFNFTTYKPIELLYSSVGDSNISLNPVFKLYYNGSFELNNDKVLLYNDDDTVNVNAEMIDSILYITPMDVLKEGSKYKLVILEGSLVDEKGILSAHYEKEFSTIDIKETFVWDSTSVAKLYKEFQYRNVRFYNNSILNNYNLLSTDKWMKITEDDGYSSSTLGLAKNYWNTNDIKLINKSIIDFDDYKDYSDIVVEDFLTEAPANTFPFVTNVRIFNSTGDEVSTVSNETITVRVEFNRDMDITVPLRVRFGSSKPYAEYEIIGQYVSARAWEGTYTLKTTIENGNQYFNISNGRAADDHYFQLFETLGRFTFEIDTFAAQAMIMQANPTAEGIQLTWMQDDFDTLAGYNVYRSNAYDGLYTRLNSYVIPADTKEFFDDTIEPGEIYYYNFTVVQTDLTESEPSGKVSVRSFDTMAPNIYHSPVHTAYTGSNLIVNATITDNLKIEEARLYYRVKGTDEWKSTKMTSLNSKYTGVIYASTIDLAGLEYYIKAFDGISYTYKGDSETPYEVTVKLAVDKNSMGDIDGDGTITAKDALMILQAANDKLNLTEEQFMRADLNGDGILSAAEALKILQFVSGKINSIL